MTAVLNRRQWLVLAGATGLSTVAGSAFASGRYPERPIRLIVPFAPGTSPDTAARQVSALAGPMLGQSIVVDNIPGAGGIIGASALRRAKPDGYTIGMLANSHAANVYTQRVRPYDIGKHFTPIAALLGGYQCVAVRTDSPFRSAKELVEAMRRQPDQLNFGSGGPASPAHLVAAMLLRQTGTRATHVPYKGANDFVMAILMNQVQFGCPPIATVLPFLRKGQVRLLAVVSPSRSTLVPDVPTLAEALSPGFWLDNWLGLFGPAGMPSDRQQTLFQASRKLQGARAFLDWAATTTSDIRISESPADFGRTVAADGVRYGKLMHELGLDASAG